MYTYPNNTQLLFLPHSSALYTVYQMLLKEGEKDISPSDISPIAILVGS